MKNNSFRHLFYLLIGIFLLASVYLPVQSLWSRLANQTKINALTSTLTARSTWYASSTKSASVTPTFLSNAETATIEEDEIKDELVQLGLDPAKGKLAWVHPPANITVQDDFQAVYRQEYPTLSVHNFIIAADIRWKTSSLLSGCGFSLRNHGAAVSPNRYLILINRLPYGYLQFTALAQGQPANIREIYLSDELISLENDATNHLAVVAIENILTVYLNWEKIADIDVAAPPSMLDNLPPKPMPPPQTATDRELAAYLQLEKSYQEAVRKVSERYKAIEGAFYSASPIFNQGSVGLVAINHTGVTECHFSNAWLWSLDP